MTDDHMGDFSMKVEGEVGAVGDQQVFEFVVGYMGGCLAVDVDC